YHTAGLCQSRFGTLNKLVARGSMDALHLYKEQKNDFDIEENEDKKLVENVSAEIEKLLTNKVIALKKLTETAETLQKNHQWNDDIKEENVTYFNAKQHIKVRGEDEGEEEVFPNQIDAKFETDPAFKNPVNDSYTAVHIPT
uniref:VWA N-terminal domain-containing protein n=1 Tax=Petromyzon marinus TaxID=7757 RepID=S4RYX4_PETMA